MFDKIKKQLQDFIFGLLLQSILKATPDMIRGIRTMLAEWKVKAEATDNPWDDIFVNLLIALTGGPLEE